MNMLPRTAWLAGLLLGPSLYSQETSAPAKPPSVEASSPAATEMQKWLQAQDAYWKSLLAQEATDPYQAELSAAAEKYRANIEARIKEASQAGDLDSALAWKRERELFAIAPEVPAEDRPGLPPTLLHLRAAWRTLAARLTRTRADKTRGVLARYDAALVQAQTELTKRQRFDDAVLVKEQRERVAAITPALEPAPPADNPPATATTPKPSPSLPPLGQARMLTTDITTQRFAQVQVAGGQIVKLAKDEKLWTDRPVTLQVIPGKYQGFTFTQLPAHSTTLTFKVLAEGVVAMGCTARWGTTADPNVAKEFTTEQKLVKAGWVRQKRDQIETTSQEMQFLIFARYCKAGEEFSYRTEKYAPPILLMK